MFLFTADDEVNFKICSDVDIADCCSAKLDKGVRKDEWEKSKTENWESREFRECKNKPFKVFKQQTYFSRPKKYIYTNSWVSCLNTFQHIYRSEMVHYYQSPKKAVII